MARTTDVIARWPLIGREHEQRSLASAMRDPRCNGALIVGPAGVGKTRLADEARSVACASGTVARHIAATRAGQEVPLGALFGLIPAVDAAPRPPDAVRSAVDHLEGLGGAHRLLLVVDDAHLLDPTSALVIHQLARQGRAFLILTMRSSVGVADPLSALWKDDVALRLDLDPLTREQVGHLLRRVLGGHVEGSTVRRLWEMSQGNPLYLRELVLGALDAGLLEATDEVWFLDGFPHSPRLTELVEIRLSDLTEHERAVLEYLAFAEPLPLALAERLAAPQVIDALDRVGLLSVTSSGEQTGLLFAHPVHGEVLRGSTTPVRAVMVNRALADAAEGLLGMDPLKVAAWRLDGGGRVGTDQMVAAARRARFVNDAALAELLARAALDAGGGIDAAMLLGGALVALGRHAEANVLLAGLTDQVSTDGDRAMLAMNRAASLFWGLERPREADAILEKAAADLPEGAWRDEVLGVRAVDLLLSGRFLEAAAAALPLLDRTTGRARVEAATVVAPALAVAGRATEAIAVASAAYDECVALGDQLDLSNPGTHLVAKAFAELEAGLVADAVTTADQAYDEAVAIQSVDGQAWGALLVSRAALLSGQFDLADRFAAEGALLFRSEDRTGTARWCLACRAWALANQGRQALAEASVDELDEMPADHLRMMEVDVERARAWVAAGSDPDAAAARLLHAGRSGQESGTLALAAGAFHDLVRVGRADVALGPLGELALEVDGQLMTIRLDHARAAADDDAPGLDRVASAFERIGALPLAGEAAAQASAAWRAAGRMREAHRAADQARALAGRCGDLATPAMLLAGEPAVLTDREREVARMAAAGLTNRDIAARLGRSVRTVENHLQRTFDKLGAHGRDELRRHLELDHS